MFVLPVITKLVFFWSSLIYYTSVRHKRHKCDKSDTNATLLRDEQQQCYTSATQTTRVHEWKLLILITRRVTTYFYTPIFTMWQVKDYELRNNFILRTANALFPCQNSFEKCTTKTELFDGKSYIKRLYARL